MFDNRASGICDISFPVPTPYALHTWIPSSENSIFESRLTPSILYESIEGLTIKRLDFSDPQGGKGACDRKAASVKSHIHIYLNSGHDIETPEQMTDAIRSSGGVPSLSVTFCDSITNNGGPAVIAASIVEADFLQAWYDVLELLNDVYHYCENCAAVLTTRQHLKRSAFETGR